MKRFRAIATDLDGTLLRSDGTVSERTQRAVRDAEDAGLQFIIATGRPPRWIAPVVEQLGERGLVICANGAAVYDPAQHELISTVEIAAAVALELVDEIQLAFPEALLGVEQGFEFAIDESYKQKGQDLAASWKLEGLRIGPIRSFLTTGVLKLMVRLPRSEASGASVTMQKVVGDRALVTHSIDESFLELSHPSVHKAAAVEQLLYASDVDASQVAAFGDMPNDLELIRWAGLGVAVANAHQHLLDVADEVTFSNDADGVAVVIERILAEQFDQS